MKAQQWTALVACGLMIACLGASGCKGGGASKEVAMVTLSYTATPTEALPKGLERVAVLDSDTTDDAEKKWSEMAANMISGLLDQVARQGGQKLTVTDRKNIKKVMAEKDMAMAGLVDGAQAAQAAKLIGAQAIIASAINVKVEKHTGKRRTISAANIYSWRHGVPHMQTEQVDKVSRNITVQCTFRLLDAANSKVLIDHVSPTLRKTDETKPSPFMGASQTEAELTPRDKIIGELVEKEVRRFIGRFLPCPIEETVEVRASKNDACKAGVRFLAAGDYDEAIGMFQEAIAASEEGDKYASFGTGVACEAKGDLDKALTNYRTAVRLDAPGAEQGMKRVKARMAAAGGK